MNSVGSSAIELAMHRRLVNVRMEFGEDLEEALGGVPEELRGELRQQIEEERGQVNLFYRRGATLQDGGPRPWFDSWDPNAGYYWRRLREYLIDRKGRSREVVDDLNQSSDEVLRHLEDPRTDGPYSRDEFRVQGLVLGYVQSGKTANFTAVIAKAADRGYRLIIVLSGIHNSLRAQTQRRLDLELGLVSDTLGVGLPDGDHTWWGITKADLKGDFDPRTNAGPLRQGVRGIMVVKKNATVLRRLVRWLADEGLEDLPVLVIDDEADQASINTVQADDVDLGDDVEGSVQEEIDPSRINGLIRELLEKFHRVSYVAYTATPFANVLIDPDVESQRFGSDLYPSDFIISLPRPAAYVGAERIFGRPALDREAEEIAGLDIVRIVPDEERDELIPKGRVATSAWEPAITESLGLAILDWILASAAKMQRLGDGISSMLIHTSQRIIHQNELAVVVDNELKTIRTRWRYDRDKIRPALLKRWNEDFRPVTASYNVSSDVPFSDIEPFVDTLLADKDALQLLVLNSDSPDLLDYESDSTIKVLLIGGNRLSRGLTLEDLTVSFYVREATSYDTLLQMGRWFGYRASFVDLTRLWTTSELVARFRHLALVEEDLRDHIALYAREPGLTPRHLAPKILSHPAMLVTAKNRMGSATTVRQSYAGALLNTVRFRLGNDEWLSTNLKVTRQLLGSLGVPREDPAEGRRPSWGNVPWEWIVGYLEQFQTAQDAMSFDAKTAARYIRRQAERHGELTSWTVGVRNALESNEDLGAEDLNIEGWSPVALISRSRLKADDGSIGALVTTAEKGNFRRADESLDLDDAQLAVAQSQADTFPTLGHALRWQRPRSKGLLLIYPISPKSKEGRNAIARRALFDDPTGRPTVIGIALSFPPSDTGATVEYTAGKPSVHALTSSDETG